MEAFRRDCLVVKHRRLRQEYMELEFIAEELAATASPGQFVHVRVGDSLDPLLRRPLSIADVDTHARSITLFYRIVGRGTDLLSRVPVEGKVDVMGPLGRGFTLNPGMKRVLVLAGGIGLAPMFFLTRRLIQQGTAVQFLLGAPNTQHLLGKPRLQELGASVLVCTDDGSQGVRGVVTDLMEEALGAGEYDFFYACGPEGMLKAAQDLAARFGLPGELSLEAHMACGVGACLGCSHRVLIDGAEGYARVCKEGPVFPAREVLF